VKKVLIPAMLPHPDGDALLAEAPDVEVIYALSEEERSHGYFAPDRHDLRRTAMQAGIDRWLPEVNAMHCLGVGGHLVVTAEMIKSARSLEVLFIASSGTDKIDLATATEEGVLVINAPGANAPAVAEHTVGLMLSLARRIADSDRSMHLEQRVVPGRLALTPPALSTLSGKTLGLVGLGFIGGAVARICSSAFGMRVLAYDPYADPESAQRAGVELAADLHAMLRESDFVSIHAPLTPATSKLIGEAELASMKATAYLVNTSRGGLVDTDSLLVALETRDIAGAGLDVTDPEPLPDGHALFALENVVLTPHSGGNSPEVMSPMATTAVGLALDALRGQRPAHLVNPDVWERRKALSVDSVGARSR
jgi:D-3-phosphoglycerate dehydrogenase